MFLELVRDADAVVEAMRPGGLDAARPRLRGPPRGQPADRVLHDLRLRHDRSVPATCRATASPTTRGPASSQPEVDDDGFCDMPEHVVDRHQRRSAVRRARHPRRRHPGARRPARAAGSRSRSPTPPRRSTGCRSETCKAYERPESEVTGNKSDNYERRARHRRHAGRRALPDLRDQPTATCCSWRPSSEFWKNFCEGVGRPDLFEAQPGSKYADHARGNTELQTELRDIFRTRTTAEWLDFGGEAQHADRAR